MYFKTAERNEVFRILDKIQPRRILDFGCNAGYEAHRIQEYSGADVYGYDLNEHALDRGRAEFPNLHFLDRLQYPKFDGMFDLIVMSHVLEHIPDPEQIITETLERLNDGGYLLIILPQEREGVDRVLNAASLTYVAAAISTLLTLLYFLWRSGLIGGRR